MDMNGRSAFITTSDPRRLLIWQALFGQGVDRLPVKSAQTRWQWVRGELGPEEIPAFDLDPARLHWMSLAHAQRRGLTMADLEAMYIRRTADIVVQTAVSSEWVKRPFALFAREHPERYAAV